MQADIYVSLRSPTFRSIYFSVHFFVFSFTWPTFYRLFTHIEIEWMGRCVESGAIKWFFF